MTREKLVSFILQKQNFLCIGLDTDIERIPRHLLDCEDPVFEFNKAIIDATCDLCVAYKPNLAFYESMGPSGWLSLEKTMNYIPKDIFTIADAKRGDIGNTSAMYAKTFFSYFHFDAVTVAPYMGRDSVEPFLAFEDKWVIVLGLTSNVGSQDFQQIRSMDGETLYSSVIRKAQQWGSPDNLMFVIGATHPDAFSEIRSIAPDNFFLVPGIGAQGGDLEGVFQAGANKDISLLVNSSRDIIYAGSGEDFAVQARAKTIQLVESMRRLMAD